MENKNYTFYPTRRQAMAMDALYAPHNSEVLYGGAKGGGKSYFLCHWALLQCKRIIKHCNIVDIPKFPIPVGFLGRKRGSDFGTTTLETWKKSIPPELYEIKGKPAEIIIEGKVKINTGGLDNLAVVNKFNSAEYFFFGIDQAEEVEKDDISVLRGSLRGIINGKHLPYKALWTANPASCWLKPDFIDRPTDRLVFVPALPTDNPHLPEGYIDTLTQAFKHRPELLSAYLDGSWDCFAGFDQVIKDTWIKAARTLSLYPTETRKFISCDPARFGDDETVIYRFENTVIKEEIIYGEKDLHYTSGLLNRLSLDNGDIPIIVDGIGVGSGIVDNLGAYGRTVIEHKGSNKPFDDTQYVNMRAEAWCTVGKMFSEADIEFRSEDTQLVTQLCTPKYLFRSGKILIEDKAEIKKRLGQSPDRGDAYVMGMYHYKDIMPVVDKGREMAAAGGVGIPSYLRR